MKYFAMLKNWYNTSRPNKTLIFAQLVTAICANTLHVVATIPAAKAASSLALGNYDSVYMWILVGFALLVLRNIIFHFNFKLLPMQLTIVYDYSQTRIISKVFNADDRSLKMTSKEKIINTISTNVYNCGEFSGILSTRIAYFVRAVIMLIIVLSIVWQIGLMIIGISVVVFLFLKIIYTKLGVVSKEIASNKDAIFEGFSDIVDNRVISNDLNINDQLRRDYESRTSDLLKSYNKRRKYESLRDNWIFVLWNAITMLATIYLVLKMSYGSFELAIYLIITPYLTSTLDYFTLFFNLFADLENVNISANRLNNIYSMTDSELIEFGNNQMDKIPSKIQFSKVSCSSGNSGRSEGCSKIKNVSFTVNEGEIALIQGQRGSGKRTIFYILRRAIRPDSGRVLLGDNDIYSYDRKVYVHNLGYITSAPFFFNASVMENLKYLEPNEKEIMKICKKLGIKKMIEELSSGFETNMVTHKSEFSEYLLFMIGVARVILTRSEVIILYEFPRLGKEDLGFIKNMLLELKQKRCIIIFSANDNARDIANKHFIMTNGKLENAKSKLLRDAPTVEPRS